jgi:hypothetical protein
MIILLVVRALFSEMWHSVVWYKGSMDLNPALVAQTMFQLGLVQMIAIQWYIEHFRFSWAIIFFCKEKVTDTVHLMTVTQSDINNPSIRLYILMTLKTIHMNLHYPILYKAGMYLMTSTGLHKLHRWELPSSFCSTLHNCT